MLEKMRETWLNGTYPKLTSFVRTHSERHAERKDRKRRKTADASRRRNRK